jgi:hypothetical protein
VDFDYPQFRLIRLLSPEEIGGVDDPIQQVIPRSGFYEDEVLMIEAGNFINSGFLSLGILSARPGYNVGSAHQLWPPSRIRVSRSMNSATIGTK